MGGGSEEDAEQTVTSRPVIFHPAADQELNKAIDWYLEVKRSPRAAAGLADAVESAVREIASDPQGWPVHTLGIQRFKLKRYPYLAIYVVFEEHIEIVAIAHTRRRTGYWKHRLSR